MLIFLREVRTPLIIMKIVPICKVSIFSKNFKKQNKTIVLVGGCFDILHPGHVTFLEKAKKVGDCLFVLLESDQKVRRLKGVNRPVHTQSERAKVLSALCAVDHIVMLPYMELDKEYDELVGKIGPDIIAATFKDVNISKHRRAAKKVGAKLKFVTKMISDHSTSRVLNY